MQPVTEYFDDEPAISTSRAGRQNLREYDRQKAVQGNHTRVSIGRNTHHSLFRQICTDQNLYRAGLKTADECHPDCDLSVSTSLLPQARDFLSLAGVSIPDNMPTLQVVSRAMGNSDFPELLADTANRAATLGYDSAPEIWPLITRTTHNQDFKPFSRVTAPELPAPPEVGPNGEIQHAQLGSDSAETGQIASFAEIINISREAILNDDLAAVTVTPHAAGRAVSRLLGDKVFSVLSLNSALDSDVVLFHSTHGNVGTPGAPSISTLDEIRGLFAAQTGPSGEKLNIRPRFILAAPTLESSLAVIRQAQNTPSLMSHRAAMSSR
jgi:hypothetical protein